MGEIIMNMAYCDYIAHTILKPALEKDRIGEGIVESVGLVKMDLEPEEGYMVSTSKWVDVVDVNGKMYRVTVEEID